MNTAKAIIYARVSDDRQRENTSLDSQEAVCRDWCRERNIEVARVFRDEGESAKTADRPQFQALLKATEDNHGRLSYLVVYKFNRFARSQHDHVTFAMLLKGRGIEVRSATEATDNSPFGRAMEGFMAVFNQLDNDMRSENTVRGMKSRLDSGRWQWKSPLGYLNGGKGQPSLVIDPNAGSRIRELFENIATGRCTKSEALRHGTALGLRTKKGDHLKANTLDKLLRNRIYAGQIEVPGWGKAVKGDFEALIPEDLFNRVQDVLDGRAVVPVPHRRRNEHFPLRGTLRCIVCKHFLTGSRSRGKSGNKFAYYHCYRGKHVNVRAEKIEHQFVELLQRLQPQPERLELVTAIFRKVWRQRQASAETEMESLQRQLGELNTRKRRILEAYSSGRITDADFQQFYESMKTDIANVHSSLSLAESSNLDVDTVLDYFKHLCWNTYLMWIDADLTGKQRLQKALFPLGLEYSPETGLGTPLSSCIFNLFGEIEASESQLASPSPLSSNPATAFVLLVSRIAKTVSKPAIEAWSDRRSLTARSSPPS